MHEKVENVNIVLNMHRIMYKKDMGMTWLREVNLPGSHKGDNKAFYAGGRVFPTGGQRKIKTAVPAGNPRADGRCADGFLF